MKDREFYESRLLDPGVADDRALTVTWFGTAGVHVHDGTTGIFIDPYVSRFPLSRMLAGKQLVPDPNAVGNALSRTGPVSAIVVSHSHFDHLVDAPLFSLLTGAPILGSPSTAALARAAGVPERRIVPCEAGHEIAFGAFTLRFLESRHGKSLIGTTLLDGEIDPYLRIPAPFYAYKTGKVFTIVLKHKLGTLVHHGSAGYEPGMYDGITCDMLFQGIAQRGNTTEYLASTAVPLRPAMVVPIHFDNFFRRPFDSMRLLPFVALRDYAATAGRLLPGAKVRTLFPGMPVRVSFQSPPE